MPFSKNIGDLGAGKSSPPARSASPSNDSSSVERQLKMGADVSTSTSRGSLLQSSLPAGQTDTGDGSQADHSNNMLEGTVAGGPVLSGAAPQRADAGSGNLVVWKNPLPKPTKSTAYQLDPKGARCHGWEGGACTERGWDAYSINPEADFDVRRRRT